MPWERITAMSTDHWQKYVKIFLLIRNGLRLVMVGDSGHVEHTLCNEFGSSIGEKISVRKFVNSGSLFSGHPMYMCNISIRCK